MGLRKLYIDLDRCLSCDDENCSCSYIFHPKNSGIINLMEVATFAVICRKCEEGTCVRSCPEDALEKREDGILTRYNMRCISCKSCSLACPFGTIIPEIIPYKVSQCDFCLGRVAQNEIPVCVATCRSDAIKYGDFKQDLTKGEYAVGGNMIVKAYAWDRVSKRVK